MAVKSESKGYNGNADRGPCHGNICESGFIKQ